MLKLGRDKNGNKVLKYITGTSEKGFSVQTLGNLPYTHNRESFELDKSYSYYEFVNFVKLHGTDRQKNLLGLTNKYRINL